MKDVTSATELLQVKAWSTLTIASVVIPLLGIGLVALLVDKSAIAIPYKSPAFTEGVNVASALFVVALFMERSLAVLNNLIFPEEQRIAEAAILTANNEHEVVKAITLMSIVSTKKERVRLAVGFIFGLLISGAGPRTLQGLLNLDLSKLTATDATRLTDNHLMLFYGIDIILTAGLLAGGSNAINEIIELLRNKGKAMYWKLIFDLRQTRL